VAQKRHLQQFFKRCSLVIFPMEFSLLGHFCKDKPVVCSAYFCDEGFPRGFDKVILHQQRWLTWMGVGLFV